ncbi:MAG: hypothetical protein LBH73_01835 [Spirochaetaceae bacterium]|jgi:hypothetical protein|nr:hypothetical protein [Spirochaetaceae bacterium]
MFEPKGYNGITVEKKKFAFVTIPAGQAEFLGDIVWFTYVGPNIRYNFSAKDAVFSCTLEAGKEYWAVAGYKLNDDNASRTWGIYLYDDKIKARVGFPGDDKLVGFIPFNPQVLSN